MRHDPVRRASRNPACWDERPKMEALPLGEGLAACRNTPAAFRPGVPRGPHGRAADALSGPGSSGVRGRRRSSGAGGVHLSAGSLDPIFRPD